MKRRCGMKRLLSVLVCAALMVSMLSGQVFAADPDMDGLISEAVAAMEERAGKIKTNMEGYAYLTEKEKTAFTDVVDRCLAYYAEALKEAAAPEDVEARRAEGEDEFYVLNWQIWFVSTAREYIQRTEAFTYATEEEKAQAIQGMKEVFEESMAALANAETAAEARGMTDDYLVAFNAALSLAYVPDDVRDRAARWRT